MCVPFLVNVCLFSNYYQLKTNNLISKYFLELRYCVHNARLVNFKLTPTEPCYI